MGGREDGEGGRDYVRSVDNPDVGLGAYAQGQRALDKLLLPRLAQSLGVPCLTSVTLTPNSGFKLL